MLPLSERGHTDCRLPPIFAQKASSIELSAIQCNFGRGTCQEACCLNRMGLRRRFMIPNLNSPSGDTAKSQNIEYADLGTPVRVEDFCAYGLAFQRRFAPGLENKRVTLLDCTRSGSGFTLELSDGKSFAAKTVVVATGLSGFEYVPPELASLPDDLWSHSSAHVHLQQFKGRDVTVVGGGASATELATLLHEAGCQVRMVARRQSIELHTRLKLPRSLAQTIRWPISPVGPGWKSRFFTDLPHVFHGLPKPVRSRLAKGFLGPRAGGSCAGALIGFRFWQATKSWAPKPPAAKPFCGSNP